ncbi:MAG: aldo/keto reductase, partial [Symploca sp. SIO2D2]|nr:aldo/keto reductase [Symploca sp. SIO2D2]
MDRREFLTRLITSTAAATAAASGLRGATLPTTGSDRLGKLLPTRALGKTGENVTALCLGGFHSSLNDGRDSQALVETALEEGYRFFDTAHKYHGGRSEEVFGKYLTPKYREDVYILSKCDTRDPELDAATQLEVSLKRLNTDYIDLWLVHTLIDEEDAERRVMDMLEVLEEAKAAGKVRHFGVSGHYSTAALNKALAMTKDDTLDALLMPMSPVDFVSQDSFIKNVLPELLEQGVAPLAMKTMGAGRTLSSKVNGKTVIPQRLSKEENQWF